MNNDKTLKRSYWSVIPADVRYDATLGGGDAKHLYGEISALCNERGYCWATNQYFADLYTCDTRTIRRWLKQLSDGGYIYYDKDKGKQRRIFLTHNFDRRANTFTEYDEPGEEVEVTGEAEVEKPKKPTKVKREKVIKYTDQDLFLAEMLLSKIIYNFPTFENKKVTIGDWAEDMRKLREIDKASHDQIHFMIVWVQGGELIIKGRERHFEPHDFWAKNILSAAKMRKQWFDHLIPQLQSAFKKEEKKNSTADLSNKQTVAQL